MKKIGSLVFVGLFLLNSFGYYFIFSYNQGVLQQEMRGLIRSGYFRDHSELLIIANPATDPDFKWAEKGEFRYKGKLYDMISMEIKGTTTIFHCINDKKEELLISGHNSLNKILSGTNSPLRNKNTNNFHNLVIKQALVRSYLIQPPTNFSGISFYYPVQELHSINPSPPPPPPESA